MFHKCIAYVLQQKTKSTFSLVFLPIDQNKEKNQSDKVKIRIQHPEKNINFKYENYSKISRVKILKNETNVL